MDGDFAALVSAQYEPLRRAALVLARDPQDADDLVQSAFVKAHRSRTRVLGASDPAAYLHRILINTTRSANRRFWHREVAGEQAEHGVSADDADTVATRVSVRAALRTLPREQREAVVARHLLGLSEAQAAEVLGCPPGTVKSRTSRALVALRAHFPEHDLQERS